MGRRRRARGAAVPAAGTSNPDPTRLTTLTARPEARPLLESWIGRAGTLIDAAVAHPEAERLRGRGRVVVVPGAVAGERWVVRHYHRGGAVASMMGDRYLRLGTPRPVREYRLGRALEERGLPTAPHLGAAVYPAGPWYRGDLVTRWVPGSLDLAAVLFPDPTAVVDPRGAAAGGTRDIVEPVRAARAAGALLRRLHDAGLWHPDLNLKNILIASTSRGLEALVLDLDRAELRRTIGRRARGRMIERLWRSARKWSRRTGVAVDPAWRGAFQEGYDDA